MRQTSDGLIKHPGKSSRRQFLDPDALAPRGTASQRVCFIRLNAQAAGTLNGGHRLSYSPASRPLSAMTFNSLRAGPAGRVSPRSHLPTVDAVVCKTWANTGWLNFSRSRSRLMSAALNSRSGGRRDRALRGAHFRNAQMVLFRLADMLRTPFCRRVSAGSRLRAAP